MMTLHLVTCVDKFFCTKQLLKNPNKKTHDEYDNMTESKGEEIVEMKE